MRPRLAPAALLVAIASLPSAPASAEPSPVAHLTGIARGLSVPMDPFFQWKPTETRYGLIGTMQGVTREFENIGIEVVADRSVFLAPLRVAYEAYRIKTDVEPGEYQTAEVKSDLSVVRVKMQDVAYVCAAKQVGRTALAFRAWGALKYEAALAKLVSGVASRVKSAADDLDGWLPEEVKTPWTKAQDGDVLVVHDGALPEAARAAIVKAVHDAHGVVKRGLSLSWTTPFPPVVRITASRDLLLHVSQRKDLGESDAVYLPWAGELVVAPRNAAEPDAETIAPAAALQAVHHALGAVGAEPIQTGLVRQALAAAQGVESGALLPSDAERAIERLKKKEATTWSRILRLSSVAKAFARPDPERAIDAELSTLFATLSSGPQAKASFSAWLPAFKKTGHPDAAAEAACAVMEPGKADEEFWSWWTTRLEPPKKPKPGEKPPAAPTKPPGMR